MILNESKTAESALTGRNPAADPLLRDEPTIELVSRALGEDGGG